MADAHDTQFLVDLAKIFEDDHDMHLHAPMPAAPVQQVGTGAQQTGDTPSPPMDPFLLQGDEQTWDIGDWEWDPYGLAAAPKEAAQAGGQCCQALKRRKLPAEVMAAVPDSHKELMQQQAAQHAQQAAAAQQQQAQQQRQYSMNGAGATSAALTPGAAASSCCSFQMPPSAMGVAPSAANAGVSADPAARTSYAGMYAPGAAGGIAPPTAAWPTFNAGLAWQQPSLAPAMMASMAMAPSFYAAAAAAQTGRSTPGALPATGPADSMGAMPMGARPAQAGGVLPVTNAATPAMKHVLHHSASGTRLNMAGAAAAPSPKSQAMLRQGSSALAESANTSAASGPARTTRVVLHRMPSSAAAQQPPQPPAPSATADAQSSDGEDSEGEQGGATGRKRGPQLAPATYTGSMEGVVSISDHCPDDSARMACQVAGCGKDLGPLKEYHQRYRICEVHIKLPQVLKDGRLQRFCQQCGRFHDLSAFDGNRKSCREQLCKHNARRRRRAQIEAQKAKAVEVLSGSVAAAGAAVPAAGEGPAAPGDVGRLLAALMQNPTQLHALRLLLGVQTHPALPPLQPFSPEGVADAKGPAGATSSAADQRSDASHVAVDPPSYNLARDIAAGRGEWAPAFESDHKVVRVSMKLFNRTPADLPTDLKQQVCGWLASAPAAVEGLIRPGCVFLTLSLTVDRSAAEAIAAAGLQSLLHHLLHNTGCMFWHSGAYAVQLGGDELAMVAGGRVTAYYSASGDRQGPKIEAASTGPACCKSSATAARVYPELTSVGPVCCVVGEAGAPVVELNLKGEHLDAPGCDIVCRVAGAQLRAPLKADGSGTSAVTQLPLAQAVAARGAAHCGVAWVEVARGAWLSTPRPLLLVDDAALAEEVAQLAAPACRAALSAGELDWLLLDLAAVLAHCPPADASGKVPAGSHSSHVHHGGCCGSSDAPLLAGGLPHAVVAHKARQLLVFACDMGWAAVAARVLPLATASCSCASEVVAAVSGASAGAGRAGAAGLPLLHRVVRSGNVELLRGVLHWGMVAGYSWRADRAGPGGLTPLHLAALQDDARVLLALLDHAPPGAFTRLAAADSTTPFQLAFQMGHYPADALVSTLADEKVLPPPKPPAPAAHRSKRARTGDVTNAAATGTAAHGATAAGPGRELEPCEQCHCTLPPLLLSIAAACADCGGRAPKLLGAHAGCAAAADNCAGCTVRSACCGTRSAAAAALDAANNAVGALAAVTAPAAEAPDTDPCHCPHKHGSVYSITALCQGCHANRVLEVA